MTCTYCRKPHARVLRILLGANDRRGLLARMVRAS